MGRLFLSLTMPSIAASATLSIATPSGQPGKFRSSANGTLQWNSVSIGGGGYVTGLYATTWPDGTAFARTDVGGCYRLSGNLTAAGQGTDRAVTWVPLVDSFPAEMSWAYSTESMAPDPSTPGRVYIAVGPYADWGDYGVIMWSNDHGSTWSYATSPNATLFRCGGNDNDRDGGERLLVHPSNPSIIVFGARDGSGLWSTTDGFKSFTNISLPGAVYEDRIGIQALAWSSRPDGSLALLAIVPGMGVYATNGSIAALQDPLGWSLLPGSPTDLKRLTHDAGMDTMWATGYSGVYSAVPVSSSSAPGGWGYAWTAYNSSLPKGENGYVAVAANPTDPLDVLVAPSDTGATTYVWRTLDGGRTWRQLAMARTSTVPWLQKTGWGTTNRATASLMFASTGSSGTGQRHQHADADGASDPLADVAGALPSAAAAGPSTTACLSDWYGMWCTADLAADAANPSGNVTTRWFNAERGHEEVVNFCLSTPHVGPELVSGHADVDGFAHDNGLNDYPSQQMFDMQYLFSADYTEATTTAKDGRIVPTAIVGAFGNGWEADKPHGRGGPGHAMVGTGSGASTGPPGGQQTDTDRGSYYGYHRTVAVSTDGGMSAVETAWDDLLPAWFPQRLAVAPWDATNIVVATGQGYPLVYTQDGGKTWLNASNPNITCTGTGTWDNAVPIAADRHTSQGQPATFYYYSNQDRGLLFRSRDSGSSWQQVQGSLPSRGEDKHVLVTPPSGTSAIGDLWLGLLQGTNATAGAMWRSVDGGDTITAVPGWASAPALALGPLPSNDTLAPWGVADVVSAVQACAARAEAAGLPAPRPFTASNNVNSSTAAAGYAAYALGYYSGDATTRVWVSVDYGATWASLYTPANALGDLPAVMAASRQNPGTVFVGTGGRGVFYADATAVIAEGLRGCQDKERGGS